MIKTREISNTDDVIDSRDVIARIDELEAIETRDEDEQSELDQLTALAEEGKGSPDWRYGETLIRDSYFEDYAQQLAEDCGMINANATWPNNCIDWEKAARELQVDYFAVSFGDVTYWIRG